MPANSYQLQKTPDGKYAVPAGELHLFDESDRNINWLISVNPTTSWVEHDLSAYVPRGTKAIYGSLMTHTTDALARLHIRDANSAATAIPRVVAIYRQQATEWGGRPIIIKATDGKFDIKEEDVNAEFTNLLFNLWGYFL